MISGPNQKTKKIIVNYRRATDLIYVNHFEIISLPNYFGASTDNRGITDGRMMFSKIMCGWMGSMRLWNSVVLFFVTRGFSLETEKQ